MDNPLETKIPDGGWGWMVVGAVALINMTNQAITSSFGLLFGSQLESMNQGTSAAALLTNLNSLALNFSGLFIGPAIKSFAPRNVATIGCLLVSSGLILCSFATQMWHFVVGYSLLVGIGLGFIGPSTFMAINSYFTTKRGRAVGVSLAGAGLGQMLIPHVVRIFLDNYGFRIAVMAMAGFSMIGIFGAFFFRPLPASATTKPKHNYSKGIKLLLENDSKDVKNMQLEIKILKQDELEFKRSANKETYTKKVCNKIFHRLVQAMDLELLKDPVFWSIIIGMALVYTSTVNFSMLFPYFLQKSIGLSRTDTATCMSVVAGADIVSRLLLPCITDKLKVPYRIVFLMGTVGLLVSRAALAESTSMTSILVMSIFTGMTKSATVLNNNLTISVHCKPEKLPGGLGLNMISKGILVITVGQLFGWIRDYTDSYVFCLHAQNAVLLLVIVVWTCEILHRHLKKQLSKRNQKELSTITDGTEEERKKINAESDKSIC